MSQIPQPYPGKENPRVPRYRELPPLELYKDQVVELVNAELAPFFPSGEALTDTMVNNYVKLKVITPPVKKRYSRDQLAQLVLVCLLKRVLSIAQLRRLLELQRLSGSVEHSYDELCESLERELHVASGALSGEGEKGLVNHAASAFAHKMAFERLLAQEKS